MTGVPRVLEELMLAPLVACSDSVQELNINTRSRRTLIQDVSKSGPLAENC